MQTLKSVILLLIVIHHCIALSIGDNNFLQYANVDLTAKWLWQYVAS